MGKLKRYLSCLFFSFVVFQSLNAQTNEIGSWLVYFGNQKIDNKWNIQSDFQYRNHQVLSQRNQYLLRAGVGYNLKEQNHNLLLGFAYIATDSYDEVNTFKATKFESRIYQQYLFKHKLSNANINHRVRLEQRIFPNEFGLRGRYFVSMQKPLKGKVISKNSSYISAYNELFLDIKHSRFDRNRLYLGVGYGITEHIRIETGYMIQAQKNINRGQLQFILINNLPF